MYRIKQRVDSFFYFNLKNRRDKSLEGCVGKSLIVAGAAIFLLGVCIEFGSKLGLGRLPGDINIKRDNFNFNFPIATSILISIIISAILWLFASFRK